MSSRKYKVKISLKGRGKRRGGKLGGSVMHSATCIVDRDRAYMDREEKRQ